MGTSTTQRALRHLPEIGTVARGRWLGALARDYRQLVLMAAAVIGQVRWASRCARNAG
ncbi:MAG: hypothetical protein JWP20_2541 [Roseomonas sp.]|nr:hypothetical protein [Roseomonas sp.]